MFQVTIYFHLQSKPAFILCSWQVPKSDMLKTRHLLLAIESVGHNQNLYSYLCTINAMHILHLTLLRTRLHSKFQFRCVFLTSTNLNKISVLRKFANILLLRQHLTSVAKGDIPFGIHWFWWYTKHY